MRPVSRPATCVQCSALRERLGEGIEQTLQRISGRSHQFIPSPYLSRWVPVGEELLSRIAGQSRSGLRAVVYNVRRKSTVAAAIDLLSAAVPGDRHPAPLLVATSDVSGSGVSDLPRRARVGKGLAGTAALSLRLAPTGHLPCGGCGGGPGVTHPGSIRNSRFGSSSGLI